MRKITSGLAFLALAVLACGQTPFSSISGTTMTPNTTATMTVGSGASVVTTGTGTINATFTNNGAGAMLNPLATRLQPSGYAYPDFCPTVDGGVITNNTGCLSNALAALGTSFGVLEIPAIGTTTSSNYYCLSLGTTWAAAQSRVHIWKGANLSCALPAADATHIIQDDNLAIINPWPSAGLPSTAGPAIYCCTTLNDLTSGGIYTGTGATIYGVKISSTGSPNQFSWGNNVNGTNFTGGSTGTAITQGIASASYTSGGTLPTNGLCTLQFTTGGTGGSGYFAVTAGVAGTVTITAPGYGYATAPTTAALGEACSGSAAVSATLTTGSGAMPLSNGVTVSFASLTGHTSGDQWTILATPAIVGQGFTVIPGTAGSTATGEIALQVTAPSGVVSGGNVAALFKASANQGTSPVFLVQDSAGNNQVRFSNPTSTPNTWAAYVGMAGNALGQLVLGGSSGGATTLQPTAAASGVITLPSAIGTVMLTNTALAFSQTPLTTTGDLMIASSASTLGRLGIGTQYQTLQAGGSSLPVYDAVHLDQPAAVTGILPSGNGGTGSAYFAISGPTSPVTFAFPTASATILTSNAAVTVPQGGTGLTSGTSGGIPYFSGTTAMASSAQLNQYGVVVGGGPAAAPATVTVDNTTTHALFASASNPGFRSIAQTDLPATINNAVLENWCMGSFTGAAATYVLVPASTSVNCAGTLITSAVASAMPFVCTARNLFVRLGTSPGSGVTDTITLYLNGTATSLSCTITGTGLGCADASDTVSFPVAGDHWYVAYVTGSATSAASNARALFQCQ